MKICITAVLSLFLAPLAAHADQASLSRAAGRLQGLGTPQSIAQRAARHVELGLPSAATKTDPSDLLLVRNGYVISYNAKRNAMNWASWALDDKDLGTVGRNEHFRPDATLRHAGLYTPNSNDYKIPGYSRGHMVRSGERTTTDRENSKTYVFTNMLPQAVNNNSGPWNAFEDFYREQVKSGDTVAHVIAGGVFGKAPVEARGVAVPSSTWKIVAFLKKGQKLEDIDASTRVVSIVIPNNNDEVKVEYDWARYRTSVADIEKQTGLSFFDSVSPTLAQLIKTRVDASAIPPAPPTRFTPHNYGETGEAQLQKMVATQVTGTVKWYDSDKKFGFIALADGSEVYVNSANRITTIKTGEQVTLDVGLNQRNQTFALKVRSTSPNAVLKVNEVPQASSSQPASSSGPRVLQKTVATQVSGTVKFFNEAKRFGFITLADGTDVYVNAADRVTTLAEGDAVTLDVGLNQRNQTFALKVRSLSPKATAPVAMQLEPSVTERR